MSLPTSILDPDDHDHEHFLGDQLLGLDEEPVKKGKKKRDAAALRKAPNAPKRFKSSYICFFVAKQPVIREELGEQGIVSNISKRSAEMWKNLSAEERALWDDIAAKDKQRYMIEKAHYTGPWQVPWKRIKKDPSAPKRPMSAFLYFSQGKRSQIKQQNPDMKNTEVSRILGDLWRGLSDEERSPFVEREKAEREKYKVAIVEWRQENDAKEAERKATEMQAEMATYAPQQPAMMNPYFPSYQAPYQLPNQYYPPTTGKQPILLSPNGMPYVNQPTLTQPAVRAAPQLFDDNTGLMGPNNHNFDFSDHHGDVM